MAMTVKDDHRAAGVPRGPGFLAAGGILAALAAASCCVVPFVLFLLGVSGAWIGNLTALEPYQSVFAALAVACLGSGFHLVYRRLQIVCAESSSCANPSSDRLAKIGLRTATALVFVGVAMRCCARRPR
jgi:mercuric ion transport protein